LCGLAGRNTDTNILSSNPSTLNIRLKLKAQYTLAVIIFTIVKCTVDCDYRCLYAGDEGGSDELAGW
jgi:hypothetical protein